MYSESLTCSPAVSSLADHHGSPTASVAILSPVSVHHTDFGSFLIVSFIVLAAHVCCCSSRVSHSQQSHCICRQISPRPPLAVSQVPEGLTTAFSTVICFFLLLLLLQKRSTLDKPHILHFACGASNDVLHVSSLPPPSSSVSRLVSAEIKTGM